MKKIEKKHIKYFLFFIGSFAAVSIALYLFAAFCLLKFNMYEWNSEARAIYGLCVFAVWSTGIIFIWGLNNDNRQFKMLW